MHTQLSPYQAPMLRVAAHPKAQRGVVLLMALIMLAIIAITSSLALKSVTLGDQIGHNLRNNKITQQAAEQALRWCELQVLTNTGVLTVLPASATPGLPNDEQWKTQAGWNVPAALTVPLAVVNGLGVFPTRPQCLAQEVIPNPLGSDDTARMANGLTPFIRITVRAFSPDYSRANGVSAGGESWITSTLVF